MELITQEVIENPKIVNIGYEQKQYFDCQKGAEVKKIFLSIFLFISHLKT
jgi:hypothetical protein